MNKKLLMVVDYQKDFVDGTLGFEAAKKLETKIADKVEKALADGWDVAFTLDTHYRNVYFNTREGRNLPIIHTIKGEEGWKLYGMLEKYMYSDKVILIEKTSFGSRLNTHLVDNVYTDIELCGVVTNMCVITMAVCVQTVFSNANITIDAECCASFDKELHVKALDIMESMQMKIINRCMCIPVDTLHNTNHNGTTIHSDIMYVPVLGKKTLNHISETASYQGR
jgi:nicotinamidase/pyrazinamidase